MELARVHLERDVPAAIGPALRLRVRHFHVVERDLLEQVRDQLLVLGTRHGTEPLDEVRRVGVRRRLEREFRDQAPQRLVDLVRTDLVLEQVQRETALLVMDVRLVLDAHERQLLQHFTAARAKVAVELVLQELADLLRPVHLLHHHQRRVLGQRFDDEGAALLIGADDLVTPPLVPDLVRRDVGDHVDLLGIAVVRDEADPFRVRNRVGEGLREARIVRKLQDAHLAELERAELRGEILERGFHRRVHAFDVVTMRRIVIDRQLDVLPAILRHLVAGRLHGEEIVDRSVAAIPHRTAAALDDF